MLIIFAIMVIITLALLIALWANDCHPCGKSTGHYGDSEGDKSAQLIPGCLETIDAIPDWTV